MTKLKKYSLTVRRLKIALPTLAALLLALIFAWPEFFTKIEDPIQFIEDQNQNDTLALMRPSFRLHDNEHQSMLITADSARETAARSKLIELKHLDAEILLKESTKIYAKGDRGLLDQSRQTLAIEGNIQVRTSSGHDIATEKATIDFRKKTIDSSTDVKGVSPLGKISAQGFLILNKGDEILLRRKSRVEVDGNRNINLGFGKSDDPLVITAHNTMAWRRLSRSVKASGSVMAVKGDSVLESDSATAYYSYDNQITRLNANGNVRLTAEHNKALGDSMAYDITGDTLTLTGRPARLVTPKDTVTANEITYKPSAKQAFTNSRTVLARQGAWEISADRMSLELIEAMGRTDVKSAQGEGRVSIKTEHESATGDSLVFDGGQNYAILSGNVVLKRDRSSLRGTRLHIDMNTGETTLEADTGEQVQGQYEH